MDARELEQHTLHQFDAALNELCKKELLTGGMVGSLSDEQEQLTPRAIEALLGQFGTGGNLVALRSLLFLPDALFQLAGHVFWAEWK